MLTIFLFFFLFSQHIGVKGLEKKERKTDRETERQRGKEREREKKK